MRMLITGGLGFLGANLAYHLLGKGWRVRVYDNLSRGEGCGRNMEWLRTHWNAIPENFEVLLGGDVRDTRALCKAVEGCDVIVHAAAQVSVPKSTEDPRFDFDNNAKGTFNVLEAARNSSNNPAVVYVSTNKVYGNPFPPSSFPALSLSELETRYEYSHAWRGVDELCPLGGEEPYGVSKAVGDLYIHAYRQMYGLKAVSFRCSCMYGPHQWGREEQGWVAWFIIAALLGKTLTIFGDGKQVRDLLYVDDMCRAVDLALEKKPWGEAFNLGGGRENAVSLLETIAYLEELTGGKINLRYADWRPGDNRLYYTDYSKARSLLGWQPKVSWREGVAKTLEWVKENLPQIRAVYT